MRSKSQLGLLDPRRPPPQPLKRRTASRRANRPTRQEWNLNADIRPPLCHG